MKEVELHPSEVTKETTTRVKLGCLSRCDGSAVLMSKLGSCCAGVIGPVEAKEKDQDPIKTICVVNLHPPSGNQFSKIFKIFFFKLRFLIQEPWRDQFTEKWRKLFGE